MRTSVAILFMTSLPFCFVNSWAGDQLQQNGDLPNGYYLVVAAYGPGKISYAERYAREVESMGHQTDYGFSRIKGLYFVYTHYSQNFKESLRELKELRTKTQFADAWVFVNRGKMQAKTTTITVRDQTAEQNNDGAYQGQDVEIADTGENTVEVTDQKPDPAEVDATKNIPDKSQIEEQKAKGKPTFLGDFQVYFDLTNATTGKPVNGEVQVIDTERSKLSGTLPSGSLVNIRDPDNGTGRITLLAEVFGYRKMQREINFYTPLEAEEGDNVQVEGDTLLIDFTLVRYAKGDLITMYNVFFFKDAAVMRPESKFELNSLLEMLEENPGFKIRIHGHTNGNAPGKIITRPDRGDFFVLANDAKEGFGSAKKLSEERASIIREYLIAQGISKDRLFIKAWGGKRMIYDKHSAQARRNVRVEVEILQD